MQNIKDIVSKYVILKKNNFGKCPFHKDQIGIFYVDEWNNQACCPVCNKSWSPIAFIADREKLSSYEAYSSINPITIEDEKWKDPYKEIQAQVNIFKSKFKGSPAEEYMQSRGIDYITAQHYSLGYSDNGFFANRVIFPIKNMYGQFVGMTARTLSGEDPKYKNSRATGIFSKKRLLYGYDPEFKYASYLLVEGQMDVIKLQSIGYGNAVCSSGTAINRDQLIKLGHVHILFDQDEAGEKATNRTIEICEEIGITYSVVTLNGAKDPDEFISNGGDIFSVVPYEINVERIEKKDNTNLLSTYSFVSEEVIEASMVSKPWIKSCSDSVLNYYISNIYDLPTRYRIEKELRFRRGGSKSDVSIDELKLSIPIESVIESYGITIPQGRGNIPCPLPEHKDGTPSFSINKQRNLFKCFGCGKGGTQIDFIKEMEQCDTMTAINKFITFS